MLGGMAFPQRALGDGLPRSLVYLQHCGSHYSYFICCRFCSCHHTCLANLLLPVCYELESQAARFVWNASDYNGENRMLQFRMLVLGELQAKSPFETWHYSSSPFTIFLPSSGRKKINILKCCIGDIKAGCISFRVVNFTALQQIKHMGDRKSLARNLSQRMERGRPIRPAQLRQWRCDWMLLLSVTFAPRKATKGPTLSPSKQTPISGSSASRAILVCSHPCKHKSSHQQNRSLLDYL